MKPYLSFVMAARNDDFGGNFLDRFQSCVNSILALSHKHNLNAELIIMEWNPPDDKPRLKDAINWPKNISPASVRIIEIPNEIHRRYKNSEKIPFFEFFAKNAGIRRAKGEYVLATNSDIIFSDEMIKYFASRPFAENVFCRADRYDIKIKDASFFKQPLEEQIRFCQNNIFQIQTMHGALIQSSSEWFKTRVLERLKRLNIKKIINKFKSYARKTTSPTENKNGGERFRGLYINAGGDFMLMSKKNWDHFKGYPALGIDRGLDCYMTIMAHIAGLLQVVLPFPIYHIEHDRSAQYLRPTAVLENMPAFEKMVETNKEVITNDDNWGFKNEKLNEFIIE